MSPNHKSKIRRQPSDYLSSYAVDSRSFACQPLNKCGFSLVHTRRLPASLKRTIPFFRGLVPPGLRPPVIIAKLYQI